MAWLISRPSPRVWPATAAGKTTCAVFRMFDHWRAKFEVGEALHQVFITVSATLKDQVGRQSCLCCCMGGQQSQEQPLLQQFLDP